MTTYPATRYAHCPLLTTAQIDDELNLECFHIEVEAQEYCEVEDAWFGGYAQVTDTVADLEIITEDTIEEAIKFLNTMDELAEM